MGDIDATEADGELTFDNTSQQTEETTALIPTKDTSELDETVGLIYNAVRRESLMGMMLNIADRVFFMIFAVYATAIYGVSKKSTGVFLMIYAITACILGGGFTIFGNRYGFDIAFTGMFFLPVLGFAIAWAATSYTVFLVGTILTATVMSRELVSVAYTGKLAKISGILTGKPQSKYAREFVPLVWVPQAFSHVLAPLITGGLYTVYALGPFIFSFWLCLVASAYGLWAVVGNWAEIMSRTKFGDVATEGASDADNYDRIMLAKVFFLSTSRFMISAGTHGILAYYILFMQEEFGVSAFYVSVQLSCRPVFGFMVAMAMKRYHDYINPNYANLLAAAFSFTSAFSFYIVTTVPSALPYALTLSWPLYIMLGIGHAMATIALQILLVETSSRGFMSRASTVMGMLVIFANGFGPLLYVMSGLNLFLFESVCRFFSIVLYCGYLLLMVVAK